MFFWDTEGHIEPASGLEFELSPIRDYDSGDYISNTTDTDLVMIDTKSFNKRILRGKRNGDLCHVTDSGLHRSGPLESDHQPDRSRVQQVWNVPDAR